MKLKKEDSFDEKATLSDEISAEFKTMHAMTKSLSSCIRVITKNTQIYAAQLLPEYVQF